MGASAPTDGVSVRTSQRMVFRIQKAPQDSRNQEDSKDTGDSKDSKEAKGVEGLKQDPKGLGSWGKDQS